ncbi:MAG: hypothetical protein OEZ35_09580 [Candidatus Bathyarchaeota archaeon]|nr:hypothetical protein [Candidatus Bathyarchaeota archaeon]
MARDVYRWLRYYVDGRKAFRSRLSAYWQTIKEKRGNLRGISPE